MANAFCVDKRSMLQQWNTDQQDTASSSVIVKNLSPATKEETIIIHFQKRRNGGGEVKSVRLLREGVAVVTFETPEVADSVLTRRHQIDGVQVTLERKLQPCQDQVFGKVAGRLDPHNLGVRFSNMEAILQRIQDETEVEWKEIFDGFVVSGTFEQIKRVHELLNDHLPTKKLHKKESIQKYSSQRMARQSMVGSNPPTGPNSFRTPTDSMATIDEASAEVRKYDKTLTSEKSRYGKPSLADSNFQENFLISESEKANGLSKPDITSDASRLLRAKVTHISSRRKNNGKARGQTGAGPKSVSKDRPTAVTPSAEKQLVFFDDNKEKSVKASLPKIEVGVDALPPSQVSEIRNTSTTDNRIPEREESEQNGETKDRQLALDAGKGKNERKCLAAAIPSQNESCEDVRSKSTLFNENCTAEKTSSILPALNDACAQENQVHNERPKSAELIKKSESLSNEKGKHTKEGNSLNYTTSTGITVMLLRGDITDQDVDVLLSPANPTLSCKEGLSKVIFEKGGQDIEDECLGITQTEGKLEYGTTRFTSSGQLPCRVVLHAVLPPWIKENGNEKACKLQIHRCLKDGLVLASAHRHRSVAFPLLGQGWNCIPLEVSIEVITRAIAAFCKSVGPIHSGINDIRIVCEEDTTFDAFAKELMSFSVRDEKPFFVSASKTKLNDQARNEVLKYDKPLTSEKSRYGKPSLADSNFQENFPASESEKANGLSKPDITSDASRLLRAKVTHISSTRKNNGKTQGQTGAEPESVSKDQPTAVTSSAEKQLVFFQENKEKSVKVSLPKTEVGVDALPPSQVFEIRNTSTTDNMIPEREESEQNGETKDRQLALDAGKGKNERKCLAAAIPSQNESCEDERSESTLFNENCTTKEGNSLNYTTSTGITVMLLRGDITDQDVDVLLSPANPTLSCKEGLSKVIFEKGGQDIEDECLGITQTEGKLEYGTTRFTSSGQLPCRVVLHAVLPPWIKENGNEKACKLQIHRCLKDGLVLASGHRHRSVAFPPLGQGWNCIPLEVSTEVITRAIAAFCKNVGPMHSGINDIRIVCEEDATFDAFAKELMSFSVRDEKPFFVSASKTKLNDHAHQILKNQRSGGECNKCNRDVNSSIEKEGSVEQVQKTPSSPGSESILAKESVEILAGLPKIETATASQIESHSCESQVILPGKNDDLTSNNRKQLFESTVTCIPRSYAESTEMLETKALEILEVTGTTAVGLEEETSKRITFQEETKRELVEEFNFDPSKKDCVMESGELTEETSWPKNGKLMRPEILQSKALHSPAHNEQNEDILSSEAHSSQGNAKDTTSLHPLPDGQETSAVSSSNSALLKIDGGLFVTSPTVEFLLNADLLLGLQGLQIEHGRSRNINSNENDDTEGKGNFLSFQQEAVNSDETSSIVSCNPTSNKNHSNQVTENHPKQDKQDINENLVSSMATAAADAGHNKESNQKCDSKETKDTKDEFEPDVVVGDNHYGNKRKVSTERQVVFLCALCQDTVDHPDLIHPNVCAEHKFCDDCILKAFTFSNSCPACVDKYDLITSTMGNNVEHNTTATKVLQPPVSSKNPSLHQEGNDPHWTASPDLLQANQPPGQMMWKKYGDNLPGFEGYGTIVVTYIFYDGIQSSEHPNPGESYKGMSCMAYFPDTKEGRLVLKLLKKAFDARLVFTVSKSASDGTGHVVINGIELKTTVKSDARNGYPDSGYLSRVKLQLAARGIQ